MKRAKKKHTFRWKLAGVALAGIAVGALLMFLSATIESSEQTPQASAVTPVATAPATTAPAGPSRTPDPGAPPSSPSPEKAAAQNMSGMLFLFSLVAFAVAIIGIGWIAVDIYQSRPAWKTQTKYPRRR